MRVKQPLIKSLVAALSVALTLPLLYFGTLPSFAAISQDANLAKLEVKFFKHTYAKTTTRPGSSASKR